MQQKLILTFLVENTSCADDVVPEHGLSVYICYKNIYGLYDTGQTDLVVDNSFTMDKDLENLDWVAISHGHYDHCGGLADVFELAPFHTPLHFGTGAFRKKFAHKRAGEEVYENGNPYSMEELEKLGAMLVEHHGEREEISPGVFLVGPAERVFEHEKPAERFFLKDENGGLVIDDFNDERSLVIETTTGLVIITGCAHRGPVNIVRHAQKLFPGQRIRALIGGFHLNGDDDEVLELKVEEFTKLDIDAIGLAHCTGGKASRFLRERMPEKCFLCPAGAELEFD